MAGEIKRKLIATGIILFVIGVLVGSSVVYYLILPRAALPPKPKKPTISFMTQIAAPYWVIVQIGFERAAEDYGFIPLVYHPKTIDVTEQARVLESWSVAAIDAMVLGPNDPTALNDLINKIIDAGIPVVMEDVDAPESKRLLMVAFDPYEMGKRSARSMIWLMEQAGYYGPGKHPKVVIAIGDIITTEAVGFMRGYREVLEGAGVVIAEVLIDKGDPGLAASLAREALAKHPDIAGVEARYDYDGPVWAEALIETGRTEICLQTNALFPEIIPYIEAGVVDGVVDFRQYERGYLSGEISYKLIEAGPENWEKVCKEYIPDYPETKVLNYEFGYVTPGNLTTYAEMYPTVWELLKPK